MTRIKICGIGDEEIALVAARAGADFLGLVFAPSRRQLTSDKALAIVRAVRNLPSRPLLVGVFADMPPGKVNTIARECLLDLVQLCGSEGNEYINRIDLPVIKVVHIAPGTQAGSVRQMIETLAGASMYLLDSAALGGSGQRFDWAVAKAIPSHLKVMVAGGLNSANVGQLIREVSPWGVDVSSGVESGGRKDKDKITEFINAAIAADKEVYLATR